MLRLDDNGSAFPKARGLSRAAAEAMVQAFAARSHKQCYWACADADLDPFAQGDEGVVDAPR
ncbi:MAG: hypothetical protein KDF95_08185 [Rhodocyclaceae bacterium]|nr:hypothetical protein [Rhodocyclaceae bacterium]